MRSALIALVAALAMNLAACGGDDDLAATGDPTSSSTTTTKPADEGPDLSVDGSDCGALAEDPQPVAGTLSLEAVGAVHAGQPAGWRVTFEPEADGTLVFPSGQDAEVVLTDDAGAEVWRWSSDVMFTQAVRCVDVVAGEPFTADLSGSPVTVEPGTYTATGTLAAQQGLDPATIEVTVEP